MTTADCRQLMDESLARLLVATCTDSPTLEATVHTLPAIQHSHPHIRFLMIDSVCEFHWDDRSAGGERQGEQARSVV